MSGFMQQHDTWIQNFVEETVEERTPAGPVDWCIRENVWEGKDWTYDRP